MNIEFKVNKPHLWLESIANTIGVGIINDTVYLPDKIGEGFIKQVHYDKEFTVNYLHIKPKLSLNFIRKQGSEKTVSPIFFYINNNTHIQQFKQEIIYVGLNSSNGIFWPSNQIESKWICPINSCISNISVTIHHDWILSNFNPNEENYISMLLSEKSSFYLFDDISAEMIPILISMESILHRNPIESMDKLILKSKTIELLYLFFTKLIDRPQKNMLGKIHPQDFKKIFEIKAFIQENYYKEIKVKRVANEFSFSESKLQKMFSHVFGKSLYQYLVTIRMQQAKLLLKSGKYSVSEVGGMVGYTNLSHFSSMFFKHHGIYPKQCILYK